MKEKLKEYFKGPTILCFSIVVTGKCNAHCSYCHFYGMRDKRTIKMVWKDIDDTVYKIYIKFLKKIKTLLPDNVDLQYRFSGGDPLIMGDRIFELADYGYKETGIAPYILTNGLGITEKWIEKARNYPIRYLFISLENPFKPDSGAPNPNKIIDKINKFNSSKLPIIPGITIIKNENFKLLYNTCEYLYNKLGAIPAISELNYQAFEIPSKREYRDLYSNVSKVVEEFYNKTQLVLFPYISPELSYGGERQYLMELDIDNNKYHFAWNNIDKKIELILEQIEKNYPKSHCDKKRCDWFEFCKNYKWVWDRAFNKMALKEKQKSYCNFKKAINQAFYDAIKNVKI